MQAGGAGDQGDALGGARMGRQHVGLAGHAGAGLQGRGPVQRGEEAAGAEGIVAGPRQGAHADAVGLEFLVAGEPGQGEVRLALELRAGHRDR